MMRIRHKYLETDRPGLAFRLGMAWHDATNGGEAPLHAFDWTTAALKPSRGPGRFRFEFTARPRRAFEDGRSFEGLTIAYDLPLGILLSEQCDSLILLAFINQAELFLGAYLAGQRGEFLYQSAALLPAGGREGGPA